MGRAQANCVGLPVQAALRAGIDLNHVRDIYRVIVMLFQLWSGWRSRAFTRQAPNIARGDHVPPRIIGAVVDHGVYYSSVMFRFV